jgi:hypothetical protein
LPSASGVAAASTAIHEAILRSSADVYFDAVHGEHVMLWRVACQPVPHSVSGESVESEEEERKAIEREDLEPRSRGPDRNHHVPALRP